MKNTVSDGVESIFHSQNERILVFFHWPRVFVSNLILEIKGRYFLMKLTSLGYCRHKRNEYCLKKNFFSISEICKNMVSIVSD